MTGREKRGGRQRETGSHREKRKGDSGTECERTREGKIGREGKRTIKTIKKKEGIKKERE